MEFLTSCGRGRAQRIAAIASALLFFAFTTSAQTAPPTDWAEADIGGTSGAWSYGDDGFIVNGTGTDIWGTADSFHYVYQQLNGDGELRAHVLAVVGQGAWTKAGLMIRASLDPGSPHHYLLGSQGNGYAYQRRLTQGGQSLNTFLSFQNLWLRIVRTGTRVALGTSPDGVNWTTVTTVDWPSGPTLIGFAVTSHNSPSGPGGYGRFENVALTGNQRSAPIVTVVAPQPGEVVQPSGPYTIRWDATTTDGDAIDHFNVYRGVEQNGAIRYEPTPICLGVAGSARSCTWSSPGPSSDVAHILVVATDAKTDQGSDDSGRFSIAAPQTGTLPSGWIDQDIGQVGAAGSAGFDGKTFTVSGSGADIWGTEDEFNFAHTSKSGDFTITAKVTSVANVNQWTKAGLMIREGVGANAVHGSFFATPTTVKGIAFQYRETAGGLSGNVAGKAFAPPVWLKLVRRGQTISAYYRHNITDPWVLLEYHVYNSLAPTLDVGLVVSSHVDGKLATATFSDVTVESLPAWQLGSVGGISNSSTDYTVFGLFGKGADIWGVADAFSYAFVEWSGNGTMTARVNSIENSSAWAKAGVMFRESTTAGSKHVFAMVTPGHGANLQYRAITAGQSASAGATTGAPPAWVRLTRSGDLFTGEVSSDGVTWKPIGNVTLQMAQTLLVGIVHTSHNSSEAGGASFDDLRITR